MGFVMPLVFQPVQNMSPTNYLDFADGPGPSMIPGTTSIGQFSKDLAFELYAVVPEPATLPAGDCRAGGRALVPPTFNVCLIRVPVCISITFGLGDDS